MPGCRTLLPTSAATTPSRTPVSPSQVQSFSGSGPLSSLSSLFSSLTGEVTLAGQEAAVLWSQRLDSSHGTANASTAVCQASLPHHTPSTSARTCRHPEHTWSPQTSNLKLPLLSESPRASDTATVTQPHPKALPERPQLQRRAELPRTRPFPSSLQQHN